MDSSEIKRMILAESEHTGIRKKLMDNRAKEGGLNNDDIVEMGVAFEQMVKTKGWTYVEAYIINRANPVQLLLRHDVTPEEKGAASALITVMQYIKQVIDAKTAILERANADREGRETQA